MLRRDFLKSIAVALGGIALASVSKFVPAATHKHVEGAFLNTRGGCYDALTWKGPFDHDEKYEPGDTVYFPELCATYVCEGWTDTPDQRQHFWMLIASGQDIHNRYLPVPGEKITRMKHGFWTPKTERQ